MEEENKTSEKKVWTDEERLKLADKLDKELDDFIAGLEKKPYTEGWPEDKWEEEMAKHPFFMKEAPKPGDELHPLYEGLQQLKYDPNENTPDDLALSYKEDGNFNFKHKKYRMAIISYTEGIRTKCENKDILSALYNNRAASHYFLKNYRSSLIDSEFALKLKPDYDKVLVRAANCCYEISQFEKGVKYCDKILEKQPENKEILALRQKCINTQKERERDARKKQQAEKKKRQDEQKLIQEILSRDIKMDTEKDALRLDLLEPQFPELVNCRVHATDDGRLVWPVVFVYPEYKVMDFVREFGEDDLFVEHMTGMFEEFPEWDRDKKYILSNLNVYFENQTIRKLFKVDLNESLGSTLQKKGFVLRGGTPSFIILVKDSEAEKHFLKSYYI